MRGTAERRVALLTLLCKRRRDIIRNLAFEFGVSDRTIRTDIEILSRAFPIYTVPGCGGGVFIMEGYQLGMKYLTDQEERCLKDVACGLDRDRREIVKGVIRKFSRREVGNPHGGLVSTPILGNIEKSSHSKNVDISLIKQEFSNQIL